MKVIQYTKLDTKGDWAEDSAVVHSYVGPRSSRTNCGLMLGTLGTGWFRLAEGWDNDTPVNCVKCLEVL